jgi:hypothetical protein
MIGATIFQKGDPLLDVEITCDMVKDMIHESYPVGVSVDYQIFRNGIFGDSERAAVRFDIGVATIYASSLPPVRIRYLVNDIDFIDFHKDSHGYAKGIAEWIVGDIDRFYERGTIQG